MLPSSVFESEVEEKVGLLNKAAPQSGIIYKPTKYLIHINKKLYSL